MNDNEDLKNVSAIARAKERHTGTEPEDSDDGTSSADISDASKPTETPDESDDIKKTVKKKRRNKKTLILYILLGICIAAVIVCAAGLGIELHTSRQSIKYYSELSADIEKHPRPPRNPDYAQPSAPATSSEPSEVPEDPAHSADNSNQERPVIEEDVWVPYVDFDALSERFPGIVAWIVIPGTQLDYPVMQGSNNYYYLSYLPDGTRNRAGSVFLDYRNSPDFSDKNSLIYGHMSNVGEMFGALRNYRTQSFYEAHPVVNLYTSEHDYDLVLVAGYLVDSGVETPPMSFKDEAAFASYIRDLKRRSVFRSDVEVAADDRLVCLCTCAYDFTNARLVIVGKLVEVGWNASLNMTTQ